MSNKPFSYCRISQSALQHNARVVRMLAGGRTQLVAVVKANAYGHGMEEVVRVLEHCVDGFQVDDIDELRRLRTVTKTPAYVFGYVPKESIEECVALDGTMCVYDAERLRIIESVGEKYNKVVKVHLKIDALLGRLGVRYDDLVPLLTLIRRYRHIVIAGVYAHFANIEDTTDFSFAKKQINSYQKAIDCVRSHGFIELMTHMSATSGLIVWEQHTHAFDMVRVGIGLYGLYPSLTIKRIMLRQGYELTSALSYITHLAQVKRISRGNTVGYGLTYRAQREMTIGVVPLGYADGIDRGLSNKGIMLVGGKRCSIVGRVAMNMCMVDLSHVSNPQQEDEVVIIGKQGTATLSAESIAQKLATINYEVVARIPEHIPRIITE